MDPIHLSPNRRFIILTGTEQGDKIAVTHQAGQVKVSVNVAF